MARKKPASPALGEGDSLTGKLLIAMPNMTDPRFEHAVILMCSHDSDHAMGGIVNKPLDDVRLSELLDQLEIDQADGFADQPVYFGGPVQTDRGLVLHSLDFRIGATLEIAEGVGLTASRDILAAIAGGDSRPKRPERFFLAIGHAGWGAGQLDQEIAMNAWLHSEANADIVFAMNEDEAWRGAMKSLGVTAAMFSSAWSAIRDDDKPLN